MGKLYLLEKKLYFGLKIKKQAIIENISGKKVYFYFLGVKIYAPILVYWYENPSGYVNGKS